MPDIQVESFDPLYFNEEDHNCMSMDPHIYTLGIDEESWLQQVKFALHGLCHLPSQSVFEAREDKPR